MMKKNQSTKWIGIILVVFAVLCLAVPNATCAERKNVIIGGLSWSGSEAIEQIMKYVLEEKLNIPAKIITLTPPILCAGMGKGSVDIYPDMYMPSHQPEYDKYVVERKTMKVVKSYDNCIYGIFMSRKIAEKHGIKTIFDLRGKEKMFDTNGNGIGEMWVGPVVWSCSEKYSAAIKGYKLDLEPVKVEHWLFLAMLKEAMRKNKPLVFYYWTPEWPFAVYDLVQLEEPPYDPKKYIYVKGDPEKTHITCAHPPAYTYIGVSVKLEKRLPKAWKFFMNWYLPIEEVSKFIADLEDIPGNPKKPAPEVAKRWVESHPEILKNWLKGVN
jgi:glycine betaine/proline transport system substrate-binding protein